jgi:hypothetical protein
MGVTLLMAKFKAAGSRKAPAARSNAAAIPCLLLILTGAALLSLLFYELLKSS